MNKVIDIYDEHFDAVIQAAQTLLQVQDELARLENIYIQTNELDEIVAVKNMQIQTVRIEAALKSLATSLHQGRQTLFEQI